MSDEIKDPLLLQEDGEYSAGVETTPAEAVPPAAEGGEKSAGSGEDAGEAASPEEEPAVHSDAAEAEAVEVREPARMPVLPLRGGVVFSSMIVPIIEDRQPVLNAVEKAHAGDHRIFLCTQRDPSVDAPGPDQLYRVGVTAVVLRMSRNGEGQMRMLVQAASRAEALEVTDEGGVLTATVRELEEKPSEVSDVELEALMRFAREQSERILQLRGISAPDVVGLLNSLDEPGRLADLIAANAHVSIRDAQEMLECLDPVERLRMVGRHLSREVEIATIHAKIQGTAHADMEKGHKEYVLKEQLKAIHKELGDGADAEADLAELKKQLEEAGLPAEARKEADKQLKRLAEMQGDSAEATIARTYLDLMCELPWKKLSRDRIDIARAEAILDEEHEGLDKVKQRILEFLAVKKLNSQIHGPILCFVGPPGVGKTSLGRSIARATGRKFQRISLGGIRDEAEIRGHRRTYIGAMPGRIIQAVKNAGTRNPVIVLDEIDKLGSDYHGDPSSALLEALDPEQNAHFSDHYLNVEFDLSKVLFLCTANQLDTIPRALLDRMEVISIPGYIEQEKLAIAKKHLVPRQLKENGLKPEDAAFRDEALSAIIRGYTREAGVRNLEREIGSVCRKLARRKAEGQKKKAVVTPAMVEKFLEAPKFLDEEKDAALEPGIALGLAWTPVGGDVLHVEVSALPGKGSLQLTGQLGDVMQESAKAAVSCVRARAEQWGIEPDFMEKYDLHIHVPAGATPKDGPSAGVTMTAALVSALSGRPARADTCMTGEITLHGKVMPVGGIREKVVGAINRGLTNVLLPTANKRDLSEIPAELLQRIRVRTVDSIDELLPLALEKKKAPAKKAGARNAAKPAEKAPKAAEKAKAEEMPKAPAKQGGKAAPAKGGTARAS